MWRRRVQAVLLVCMLDYWTAPEHLHLSPQKRWLGSCLELQVPFCVSVLPLSQAGHRLILTYQPVLSEQLAAIHGLLVGISQTFQICYVL